VADTETNGHHHDNITKRSPLAIGGCSFVLRFAAIEHAFFSDYFVTAQEGTVHVFYGLLEEPLASLDKLNLSRIHTGLQRVLMLRPNTPSPTLPPDVQTLDVVAPNVVIPNQETTYWCFIQALPENMPKNHIIMVADKSLYKWKHLTLNCGCLGWTRCRGFLLLLLV